MKRLLAFFVIVILFGCGQTEKKSDGQWKTMLQVLLELKPKVVLKWGILSDGILRGNVSTNFSGWKLEVITNDRFVKITHESGYETKILFVHHPSYRAFDSSAIWDSIHINLPEINAYLLGKS